MFAGYKKFAAMPIWKRLLIGAPIALLCFWVAIRLLVVQWAELIAQADPQENQVEYQSTFFRLNGDFGMNGFKLVHFFPDGKQGPTYLADRMVIHTPGLFWLWKASFIDPKHLPDTIGVSFENIREATRTDETPGNYTNLPYDAIGCGMLLLTPAELRTMGLHSARNASLHLRRIDDGNSRLLFEVVTHGVGQLQMNFDVTVSRPLAWSNIIMAAFAAKASNISMSMKDLGFVKVRNDYCASKAGVPAERFHEFHMRAYDTRMAEGNERFSAGAVERYSEFARDGGELTISSVNAPSRNLMQFVALDRVKKMKSMPLTIQLDGGPAATFSIGPVAAAAATPEPVAPVTADAGTAAEISAPAQDPPASVIAYAQLKTMIGAHVEFSTSNGTVRRGILLSYSPYVSTLKLDPDEGGFTLSVPADTIMQVVSMPLGAAIEGELTRQVDAQTN